MKSMGSGWGEFKNTTGTERVKKVTGTSELELNFDICSIKQTGDVYYS